jgi:acyl-coenzyme A synthetase/AMP-(fatty) acid ligase
MNIVDPILFQSEIQPKAAALCAPGSAIGLISYGRLAQFIHNVARHIRKLGLASGQIVVVSIKDEIFQVAVTLALARLGIATVSGSDDRVANVVKLDAVIADEPAKFRSASQLILADLSWTKGDGKPLGPQEFPQCAPADICRIILTSGSIGEPKAIALDQRMIAARVASNSVVFGSRYSTSLRIYSDMPISTAPGFRHLIGTLWRGGTFFFPGETFETTIDSFEEYKVQCCAASPGGMEILLKGFERYPTLQSELELVIVAGDVFPRALSDRVRARLCPHVVSVYGATEVGTAASAPMPLIAGIPNAVGIVAPGVAVEMRDEAGVRLPTGHEGLIAIKNPTGVESYMGDPAATARTFRNGWFVPGDIGVLDAQNILCITGRQDALLNLGGDKINPERVEAVLAGCEGLVECAAFGAPNASGILELWVAVVADPKLQDDQLQAYCESHLGLVPTGFVRVERLPRNQMGKIERSRLSKPLLHAKSSSSASS